MNEDALDDIVSTQPLAELLRDASPLIQKSARKSNGRIAFRHETLDIQRTKDVSGSHPSSITSVSFHPSLPLLLSSGPSGLVTLHHVTPSTPAPNPILTRIALRRLPIQTSAFHPSGTRAIFAAQRRYYHVWDLESGRFHRVAGFSNQDRLQRTFQQFAPSPCGRYIGFVGSGRKGGGWVNVVDAETGQWVCTGRVEGRGGVADLAWWRSGDGLCILGKGGEVLEYSVRERRPLARWTDEGAVGATTIALGGPRIGSQKNDGLGGDRYVAIGSSAGIVNVYDRSSWKALLGVGAEQADTTTIPERPSPKRTFDQLVTSISTLKFSPDGQLLAMASQEKRDALRIIHVPSCTVYRNWPTNDTPLGRVSSLAWGEMNEEGELVLAIANDQGKIRLWQVRG
jgi:U3 small nucleolar RNA-associated protein 18